ncbi:hypothetical protein J1G44_06140 [Cellulomonas sp. zg-ZUI199]|uniref:hypothetical protein n=1 Tax=Cellulomonas TaxID=1707 RepID=UPI001A9504DE|nr:MULTISPECIES: hypothetical protein [Cellulomonas]MBO0898937.1 hypothetical protein [Cellulomonas sp. zg-ZUI22]MBO0923776.1 hypothetical protein [Cellulomonas wangleii]MBO0924058.1 hypothetical protein [Cellulomonas wangleii]
MLDTVRDDGEKAIVVAKTEDVQRALALWLREIYGLRVDIVNVTPPPPAPATPAWPRSAPSRQRPGSTSSSCHRSPSVWA